MTDKEGMSLTPRLRAVVTSAALAAAVLAGVAVPGALGSPVPAPVAAASAASATTAIAGTSDSDAVVAARKTHRSKVVRKKATRRTAPRATTTRPKAAPRKTTRPAVAPASSPRPATDSSTSYTFSSMLDGQPVRWDPCTPIRWTANTTRGPAGALSVLQSAVDQIAAQTGTTWSYVGASDTVPSNGYLPASSQAEYPPVLLGWTDGASSNLLAGQPGNVLGMTRSAWYGVQNPDGTKAAATRAAVVALDATDTLPMTGPVSWTAVALHELAHAVGLGHTSDSTQLLAPMLPRDVAGLQTGDRAGLTRLGRSAGCVTVP